MSIGDLLRVAAMDISRTMLPHIEKEYHFAAERIHKISREGKIRKDYILILTEVQSFLSTLRDFLKRVACLEQVHAELRCGRICKRWIYTENDSVRILTKLNPRLVISYDGTSIKISYDDREAIIQGTEIEYLINTFRDRVNLNNIDEILEKRSLLLDALGRLKAMLQHTEQDFELCIKELRLRC